MKDTVKWLRGHVVNLLYWKQRGTVWSGIEKLGTFEEQEIKVQ